MTALVTRASARNGAALAALLALTGCMGESGAEIPLDLPRPPWVAQCEHAGHRVTGCREVASGATVGAGAQHPPGSPVARALGCSCPERDNHGGLGLAGDGERFGWARAEGCRMHVAIGGRP